MDEQGGARAGTATQSRHFLFLYALAWAGGSISYVPLLTILLPVRVDELALGAGASKVDWLAYIAFSGAIAASAANILFGWLSDITRNRRGWILGGLLWSCILLVALPLAKDLFPLIALIVIWQCGINMMLGPLGAWAGDSVPDSQKGLLGGLLAFAPPIGALSGAIVTIPGLASADQRLWLVAAMVAGAVLPVVLFGRPRKFPELMAGDTAKSDHPFAHFKGDAAVQRMWLARLLVQIAEAALFAFLYFWLRSLDETFGDNRTATVFTIALAAAIPVALLAGRWADRRNRPIFPIALAAIVSAGGLLVMGLAPGIQVAIAGYLIFGIASTAFLSLHSAQTLRVLPRPENRGRDLGIFNLTNTVPSLIMPWLTLGLVPVFGFSGLFLLLALLAFLAGLLLLSLSRRD